MVVVAHYTVNAISVKFYTGTIYCNKTVFSKCDLFSLWSRFLAYQLLPPRVKKSPSFFCKLKVHSRARNTVTGLYSDTNEFNISFFPVYLRSHLILSYLLSLAFFLFPFRFSDWFLHSRHLWSFNVSYKFHWRLSPCFDPLHQVWCC